MINEKLAQHISNELWMQKSKVVEALESYSEEQPTIHTSKPSDIEERVKSLEAAILPTKRNLDIDTTPEDWKKVECLSWEDVIEILSSGLSIENYIKNKLKK